MYQLVIREKVKRNNTKKLYFLLITKNKKIEQNKNKKFCFKVQEITHKKIEDIK